MNPKLIKFLIALYYTTVHDPAMLQRMQDLYGKTSKERPGGLIFGYLPRNFFAERGCLRGGAV